MLLQALCSISYPLVNSNWSYSPETPNLGQIWRLLELCDLEIWRMTLQNNMAPLLCHSGLGSIPFFQFNSNSNSVIFNSNSNSNSTTHNKFQFQFQFQFRRFQFQFQFQFRRFQIPAISILEMTCWCLPWNLIIIILTRYMHIKLLLLIPSVSYPLLNGYNYMASWLILYQ